MLQKIFTINSLFIKVLLSVGALLIIASGVILGISKYNDNNSSVLSAENETLPTPTPKITPTLSATPTPTPKKVVEKVSVEKKVLFYPSPTIFPTSTPQPTISIDYGKVAELQNIVAESGRLGGISGLAQSELSFWQELQSSCRRPIYADEANTIPFSPAESDSIYNSCLSQYQPEIDKRIRTIEDVDVKLNDLKYRANIIVAECPKCLGEVKK